MRRSARSCRSMRQARRDSVGLRRRRAGRADEPVRWVKGLGLIPRVVGNSKACRTAIATRRRSRVRREWEQNPAMVTSFADGSKISFEQTIVANATGFKVRSRGCRAAWSTAASSWRSVALRYRRAARARRHRRLCGRTRRPKVFVPRRAPRSQAAALPESVQDGRGPAVPVLFLITSCISRPFAIARVVLFGTRSPSRSAGRSSRCAQSPSATCKRVRSSTTTGCT